MNKSIFVTGTGTDIGKTYITALLIRKLRNAGFNACYFKAAVSGNERTPKGLIPMDADYVNRIAGINGDLNEMVPYVYENAVSPHLASRIEGNPVEMNVVRSCYDRLAEKYDCIVAEGSGGILCPIRFDDQIIWIEDIIKELNMDTIIVADAGLGTINFTVLTIDYMKHKNITVKGIIMNHYHTGDVMEQDNIRMIEYMTGIKVIACVKDNDEDLNISESALNDIFI